MANHSKPKYLLLSLLFGLVVTGGVLALPASQEEAHAQVGPTPPSIDKECTPNPVQRGQQITCTIDVVAAPNTGAAVRVEDTFPAGLTVTDAAWQFVVNGVAGPRNPCPVTGNTVTCPEGGAGNSIVVRNFDGVNQSIRVTVDATAEQCGTFTNTATAEGVVANIGGGPEVPFATISDTEEITVVGCDERGGAARGGGVGFEIGGAQNKSGEITTENDYSISP
jgi:hypothetical protein